VTAAELLAVILMHSTHMTFFEMTALRVMPMFRSLAVFAIVLAFSSPRRWIGERGSGGKEHR